MVSNNNTSRQTNKINKCRRTHKSREPLNNQTLNKVEDLSHLSSVEEVVDDVVVIVVAVVFLSIGLMSPCLLSVDHSWGILLCELVFLVVSLFDVGPDIPLVLILNHLL